MIKPLKKVISLVLCIILTLSIITQASAETTEQQIFFENNNFTVRILNDNSHVKIVQVTDGNETSTVVLNKQTGIAKLEYQNGNNQSKNISKLNVDMNYTANKKPVTPTIAIIDSGSNWDGAYSYEVSRNYAGTEYLWDVAIPGAGYFDIKETSTNSSELNSFRTKVNEMYTKEIEIAGSFGTGTLSVIVACLTAAPESLGTSAIIALIVAAGAGVTAAVLGAQLYFIRKDAKYYFNRI